MSQTAESLTQPGDIELVRAFQGGSVEAFDQLFLRYHHAISGLTNRLVRDPLLAEDLTQETFFRVLRSLDRVDDSFNFSAWIHRIATNLCYDELRRRKRGQPPPSEEGPRASSAIVGIEDPDELLGTLASKDMSGDPEDALAMRELRREVWEVASRLPENYRMVLTLRELQGLNYAAIAAVMGLSESAIETLLHRARRRFKAEYLYLSFVQSQDDEACDALQELLLGFGMRSLKRGQRAEIQAHLDTCPECQAVMIEVSTKPSRTADPEDAAD
ncbi:MAG TPA: sigma-70 family RNA polymerase sigma factor [Candidatus Solibacter sp.]|nr:sigma-70 family RNA polymerase sigma factor [Candidatus Solibacter sp.]